MSSNISPLQLIEHGHKETFLDRHRLLVYRGVHNSAQLIGHKDFTTFFLVREGGYLADGAHSALFADSDKCFVASLNRQVQIAGDYVAIGAPGYLMNEERAAWVKPGTPGNLSYIDGCSNSNLIDPARNGDPCVNYLYFPPGTDQTEHTHPSTRILFIQSGRGVADVRNGWKKDQVTLCAGEAYILPRHVAHKFRTSSESMSLVVFHPDSEDGPHDEANPMKSRTLLTSRNK